MRRWLLAAVLVSSSCASVPIKKADALALADADARVLEGCYDCLIEARDVYARVAVGKARPLVVQRLFETELLLTLREKELALDSSQSLGRARALAKELPDGIDAARYLAIAEAVPPDATGSTDKEASAFLSAHKAVPAHVDEDLAWLATGPLSVPVRQYLSLALDCGYLLRPVPRPQGDTAVIGSVPPPLRRLDPSRTAPEGAPPLVVYRAAVCGGLALVRKPFQLVRTEVPRFVETSYFLARIGYLEAFVKGPGQVRPLLTEAYARFPASPAVTYISGSFYQLVGDCTSALRYYDETLAVKNAHEQAMLGRTICLTYLKRHDEAIATATQMIDSSMNLIEAYYWRAMNRHTLQQLDVARSDSDQAKSLLRSGAILQLAGLIELDQNDLDPAEADFKSARALRGGNRDCVSIFSLGLVYIKRERWSPSGDQFAEAMACYEKNVADDETQIIGIRGRTDLDPEYQTSQIAGSEASLKKDRSQQYASALNAAANYTRAGNYAKAKVLVEVAATDPELADKVKLLRAILKDRYEVVAQ
jgi:tetratricopeptide (TPR) repeat protein